MYRMDCSSIIAQDANEINTCQAQPSLALCPGELVPGETTLPPTVTPQDPACPAQEPGASSSCSGPVGKDCLYREFYYPGKDQITYISKATCVDGSFEIAAQSPPPLDSNNNVACPFETPKDGDSCSASLTQSADSCQYLSDTDKLIECDCLADETFGCSKPFQPKASPNNPPSCPCIEPSNTDDCSNTDGDCLYREIPCFLLSLDYLQMASCVDGKFVKADLSPDCRDVCFSGDSFVEVQDRGLVPMKQLQINDKVHVGNANFEPVYSFGHFSPTAVAHFLDVKTNHTSLQLSADHMVFSSSQGLSVPASSLRVGDKLIHGSSGDDIVVESISATTKTGVFAPFTPSGKIVVNGVLASSFVSLAESELGFVVAGSITVSHQWMAHMFEFPHRVVCHYLAKCTNESYTNEGISKWVVAPLRASRWMLVQHPIIRNTILTFIAGILYLFSIVESCLLYYPLLAIGSIVTLGVVHWRLIMRVSKFKSL